MDRIQDRERYLLTLEDAARSRTLAFWSGRRANVWPIDAVGHTLIANCLLATGESLFADWTGNEPWEAMVPSYDGSRKYVGDGFDAAFAVSLLQQHRPDLSGRFDSNWTPYESPLSVDEWLAVSEIYHLHWRQRRTAALQKMGKVNQTVSEHLASGSLKAALRLGLAFQLIGPEWWVDEGLNRLRFLTSQTDAGDASVIRMPDAATMLKGEIEPTLYPGNAWIFVTKDSLDVLKAALTTKVRLPSRKSDGGKNKLGAKPQYDWEGFRAYLFRVMDDEGNISPAADPSWRQADLVSRMQDWCEEAWKRVPGDSTIRTKVALYLRHWRESQDCQECQH